MSEQRKKVDEWASQFIASMKWSEPTDEALKTLVIGNVRGFAALVAIKLEGERPKMIPTIHLNGTSQDALLEEVTGACQALREADRVMCNAPPNGRDYYLQGAGALQKAVEEHQARRKKVLEVLGEMEALAEAISDGGHGHHNG